MNVTRVVRAPVPFAFGSGSVVIENRKRGHRRCRHEEFDQAQGVAA
jgi:hypothetical protein